MSDSACVAFVGPALAAGPGSILNGLPASGSPTPGRHP